MIRPRLVLCSGVALPDDDPKRVGREVLALDAVGEDPNVNLQITDVARALERTLSPRLVDLLEIAAYAFGADCATSRGTEWSDDGLTEAWDRDFHFVVPVRDHPFWTRREVSAALRRALTDLCRFNVTRIAARAIGSPVS